MSNLVYLNGEFVAADQASVSVLDRGFMFGDGVYEVIPVYSGKVFAAQNHLKRLQRSLDAVDIANPLDEQGWQKIMDQLVEKNTADQDAMIYLQVTRGVMSKRDHLYTRDMQPSVLIMCQPLHYQVQDNNTKGIKVVTKEDNRWADCFIKSINLLPNIMLKQYAADHDAVESILIRDGYAIEGSASNLFIVKDDIIRTPPISRHMLGGITREVILQICKDEKIVAREIAITEDELHDADEIWITSSTKEIVPVTILNQHKVGQGVVGPKWLQIIDLYQKFKQSFIQS